MPPTSARSADPRRRAAAAAGILEPPLQRGKCTPAGGAIRLVLTHCEQTAVVVVTDNGRGIAPSLLRVIFDRFRQGASGARAGGLGLGLSIAREVFELHGGSIRATSGGEKCGSTFTVSLPLHGDETPRS